MPGRLTPTIEGALAFVPAPLRGDLVLGSRTASLVGEAEYALGRVTGATGRLLNPYLVGSALLKREAILSSRIEGTVTTAEELVVVESGGPQTRSETREVLNYVRAVRHGVERLESIPVSLRLIREIHGILMEGVRGSEERPGELRSIQNFIGRPRSSVHEARFVPPPPGEVEGAMGDLEKFHHAIGSDLPLMVRLALEHYQFETIHPFRDGNGRIGRLLIVLSLIEADRLRAPMLYPSRYFEEHREEYADLLLRVSQQGDFNSWIDFFLRGIVASADDAHAQIEGLLALRERLHGMFQAARSSALLLKLIDALFQKPAITLADAARILEVTPAAANANVRKLVERGVLTEVTGRKRNQMYVARGIVEFSEEGGPTRQTPLPFT